MTYLSMQLVARGAGGGVVADAPAAVGLRRGGMSRDQQECVKDAPPVSIVTLSSAALAFRTVPAMPTVVDPSPP